MSRLTSEIFVSSLIRSVNAHGGFATLISKGQLDAGAIFILWNRSPGIFQLIGPAPQSAYGAENMRLFEVLIEQGDEATMNVRLESEKRFDPDIWIVELETAQLPDWIDLI